LGKGILVAKVQIKTAATPRAGYEYQDLAGIEVLIRQYRDPGLYAWVLIEAVGSGGQSGGQVLNCELRSAMR